MPPQGSDELLENARRLESQAVEAGDDGAEGRELRAQAVELRRRALGQRPYPVLVCPSCLRLTGWLAADGRCDSCLREAQLEAAYSDPHGGWVSLSDRHELPDDASPAPPLHARLQALLGRRSPLERALALTWMRRVDPDRTGPISPENGFELERAWRTELAASDGSGFIVRFSTVTRRFVDGRWPALDSSRIGRSDLLVPTEFSAGLPIEQLAAAWADYRAEVDAFNAAAWARESAAREAARAAREERERTVAEQHDVAELLDDGG
jgi:hypothetical protein